MPSDVAGLNQAIRDHATGVIERISGLQDPCCRDEQQLTPMNAAIRYGNMPAFQALVQHKTAIDFTPEMEKGELQRLRNMAEVMEGDSIQETEKMVADSFGQTPDVRYWLRSPLLEACRYDNREAMRALIAEGARLNARDLLGADALEIALDVGGREQVLAFMDACIAAGRRFPVNRLFLQQTMDDAELQGKALAHGKSDVKARRFLFNLACARLDLDTVETMLAEGHDLDKSRVDDHSPLDEAFTSHLLWAHQVPGHDSLCQPMTRYLESGRRNRVTKSEIRDTLETMRPWLEDAHELDDEVSARELINRLKMTESSRPDDLDPALCEGDFLDRRLALIDRLVAAGAEIADEEEEEGDALLDDVLLSNSPALLEKLWAVGLQVDPNELEDKVVHALMAGCFRAMEALLEQGVEMPPLQTHMARAYSQYRQWCGVRGKTPAEPPHPDTARGADEDLPGGGMPGAGDVVRFRKGHKAIIDSDWFWELGGESALMAALLPGTPAAGEAVTVRLTHGNAYGPMPEVTFAVRVGDPDNPTPVDGTDSVDDWQPLERVEELVDLDDEILPPEEVHPFDLAGEVPWEGTFETRLVLPPGQPVLEIRITAPVGHPVTPGVINDWRLPASARDSGGV